MTILKRIVGIIGMVLLTCAMVWFAELLIVLTMCTLGGALIAILPMLKIVIPWYMRTVKYFLTGNSKYLQKPIEKNAVPAQPKDSITQYVLNASSYGATDDIIRTSLIKEGGWTEAEVQKAFNEVRVMQLAKNY